MKGRKLIWIVVLALVLLGLYISAFVVPVEVDDVKSFGLLGKFLEQFDLFNDIIFRAVLGGVFFIIISLVIWFLNSKILNRLHNVKITLLLFILLSVINPNLVLFSEFHLVCLLIVCSEYFLATSQRFYAMLLLSVSTLVFPPMIWLVPILFAFSLLGIVEKAKEIIKSLGGIVLPLIYYLSGSYILNGEVFGALDIFIDGAKINFLPTIKIDYSNAFMGVVICLVFVHSMFYQIQTIYKNNMVVKYINRTDLVIIILFFVFAVLFYNSGFGIVLAPFVAIVISNYLSNNLNNYITNIELLLMVCSVIIYRVALFI